MGALDTTGFVTRKEFYQAISSIFFLFAFIIGSLPALRAQPMGKLYGGLAVVIAFYYFYKATSTTKSA